MATWQAKDLTTNKLIIVSIRNDFDSKYKASPKSLALLLAKCAMVVRI